MKVVRHLVDIYFHLSTRIELNAKVLEELVVSVAGDGMIIDVIGWFSNVDYGVVLHAEGNTKAKAFGGIYLHGSGGKEGSGDVYQNLHGRWAFRDKNEVIGKGKTVKA